MSQLVPPLFYSGETDQPFEKCIECERVLDENCEYIIEKAIRTYEGFSAQNTVFDYAICTSCAQNIRESFSKESIQKIDGYFMKHGAKASHLIKKGGEFDLDSCLGKCIVKGVNKEEIHEYQIYAHCKGNNLHEMIPPYMVSELAIEDVMPLLSNETSDILNGFFDKHFSPDPSILNPLPKFVLV